MTSSAVKSITSSSSNLLVGKDIQHGKLYINEEDQGIYVKSIYGDILRCGNSYRNLEDFPDFLLKETGSNTFVTIVKDDLGVNKVGTSIPFIKIGSLGNTALPNTGQNYLGFNTAGQLSSIDNPLFNLNDLADVGNIGDLARYNNWVLTWVNVTEIRVTTPFGRFKDVLGEPISGYWQLSPEASTIKHFDDCGYNYELPYQVFRIVRPQERLSYLYTNIPFPISYDSSPKLSGQTVVNKHSIINQQYTSRVVKPTSTVSYIPITSGVDSVLVIEPTSAVKLLNIDIITDSSVINTVQYSSIIIKKYKGSLGFNAGVLFENGSSIAMIGDDILLSITVTINPNISISINQKSLGLK